MRQTNVPGQGSGTTPGKAGHVLPTQIGTPGHFPKVTEFNEYMAYSGDTEYTVIWLSAMHLSWPSEIQRMAQPD